MLWLLSSAFLAHSIQIIPTVHAENTDAECANTDVALVSSLDHVLGLPPASAPDTVTATLDFDADWNEDVDGRIHAGRPMRVVYDPDRASLSNSHNGSPAWGVNGYAVYTLTDGSQTNPSIFPAITFENHQGRTTNMPIPNPTELTPPPGAVSVEMWFRNWTAGSSPGEEYDSDFGKNYHFEIQPSEPTITFGGEDSTPQPERLGEVIAGETMTITYEPTRSSNQGEDDEGNPVWGVEGNVAFTKADNTIEYLTWDATGLELDTATGEYTPIALPESLNIPEDAVFMELWFRNWAAGENDQYDSSGGHNYRFDVSDAGATAPTEGPALPSGTLSWNDGRPNMTDSFHAGSNMTVRYDEDIDFEPVSADAMPAWGVTGAVTFTMQDGSKSTATFELLEHQVDETGRIYTPTPAEVTVYIPDGATSMETWTQNWVNTPGDMNDSASRRYGFDVN